MAINSTLTPGRELAVLATMRRLTTRRLASRAGLSYWRTARILQERAQPTNGELDALRKAVFDSEAAA